MATLNENEMTTCASCGKGGDNLKKCTACKLVKYCGVACQRAHRPKHKKECQRRALELRYMNVGGDFMTSMNLKDPSNATVHMYNGVNKVPLDAIHVKVDPSVTVIPESAFEGHQYLQVVDLPQGLLDIGNKAFNNCKCLRKINFPSTLKVIGFAAFECCVNLGDITLPDGGVRLRIKAFSLCNSFQRIHIPSNIVMEGGAFLDCKNLTDVTISEGLERIGSMEFCGCESLASINLPSSLKTIGKGAFQYCKTLTKMEIPDALDGIGSRVFRGVSVRNLHVPYRCKQVDITCVDGCKHLVSLELPESSNLIEPWQDEQGIDVDIYDDDTGAVLDNLRNITLPSECSTEGRILRGCKDIKKAFGVADDGYGAWGDGNDIVSDISAALKNRFDNLPIHKICYYQSYHDTETVLGDLKRGMDTTGKHQDCLGMTPLHILACSTKQDIETYRLLVGECPETLIVKDKWGDIPLLYALWCGVPDEIIDFLVESYKSNYPDHEFDWSGVLVSLAKVHVPLSSLQKLINIQQSIFPDQMFDMQTVVMDLAAHATENMFSKNATSHISTYKYLLRISMSGRLGTLKNVGNEWGAKLEEVINDFPDMAMSREHYTKWMYAKLENELLKEAASVLELSLWKKAIDDSFASGNSENDSQKKRTRDGVGVQRSQCRINCGSGIIIPGVLSYLSFPNRELLVKNEEDCAKHTFSGIGRVWLEEEGGQQS